MHGLLADEELEINPVLWDGATEAFAAVLPPPAREFVATLV